MASLESKFRHESDDWITVTTKKLDTKKKPSPQAPAPANSAPNQSSNSSHARESTRSKEPQFCRFFQLGQCNKGSKCPFLHKKAPPHFSSELCKFFANGNCKNGERCPFSHDNSVNKPPKSHASNAPKAMSPPISLPQFSKENVLQSSRSATQKSQLSTSSSPEAESGAGGEIVWRPTGKISPQNLMENEIASEGIPRKSGDVEISGSSTSSTPSGSPSQTFQPENLKSDASQSNLGEANLPDSRHSSASMSTQSSPSGSPEIRLLSSLNSRSSQLVSSVPLAQLSASLSPSASKTPRRASQQFDLQSMVESLIGGDGGEFRDVSLLLDVDEEDETDFSTADPNLEDDPLHESMEPMSELPVLVRGLATPGKTRRHSRPESEFSFAGMFTSSSPIPIAGAHLESIFDEKKPREATQQEWSNAEKRTGSLGPAIAPILSPPTSTTTLPLGYLISSPAVPPIPKISPGLPRKTPLTPPMTSPRAPAHQIIGSPRVAVRGPQSYQSPASMHSPRGGSDPWAQITEEDEDFNPIPSHHIRPQVSSSWERPRMSSSSSSSLSPVDHAGELSTTFTHSPTNPHHTQTGALSSTPMQIHAPAAAPVEKKRQLCMYFLEGGCRFGDYCKFIHGELCGICKKPYLFPDDQQQNDKHTQQCMKEKEREDARDLVCTLCRKKVVDLGRKFGILPQCTCVFCIICIKDHRTNNNESECPRCGAASPFMVPSYGYPRDPVRKAQLLNNYMDKMRKIPCKYFDHGKGACRFGSSCHYAHKDTDGSEIVPQQLRSYVDSSGSYTQHTEVNLGMYFQKAERRKH